MDIETLISHKIFHLLLFAATTDHSSDTQYQIKMSPTWKEQYGIFQVLTTLKASIKHQMSFSRSSWVTWWAHHQFVHIPHQGILSSSFTAWRTSAICANKINYTLFKGVRKNVLNKNFLPSF